MRKWAAILPLVVLSACARPSDGPSALNIRNARMPDTQRKIPVVPLSEAPMGAQVVAPSYAPTDLGLASLRSGGYSNARLRAGDVFDVTVLDTGEDGLLSATQSKSLNLGRFTVDPKGFVTMPYVGKQKVSGSSPEGVQSQIVTALKGSSVNPQAVVTVVDQPSNAVTVDGKVRSAGRFPLTARKERVLDVLALAGGASSAPSNTTVTVTRGTQRATAPLARILQDDKQNVYLVPGDQVFVDGASQTFTALGAFKSVGEFPLEPGKTTLAQALARAGGMLDDRADSRNFYLFRNQKIYSQVASSLAKSASAPTVVSVKPVIYSVNLKQVSNFVLMQQFKMQDGDTIYASNADMVDAAKLLTVYQKSVPTAAAPLPGSSSSN
ncbi:polysaccharide export protein [Rhizobium sp. P40RR-XXII]|uniref:polysaccharide biosynthesis/export family protein n=1 Tax=unclassified Rhizobium TaxID=2613769 RepID=UPI0014577F86|nr:MULTISPECIES: polysaccharide biosynthesis/export family protein [unclassified Rhizobium]NLR89267.1 polysaccharide export protein [Rhizobium sp. P28RR-XV]NLS20129.1 polysaccharide export protein [Rhizobium sp. P40RR-XXII]